MIRVLAWFIAWCLVCQPFVVLAATKYVSPSGSASWAACGVSGTPCAVSTAMTNAVAGDVVRFLSGDYEPPSSPQWEAPAWNPSNSGVNGNPITFISDTQYGAIIHDAANGGSSDGNGAIGAFQRDWIIWDGFTVLHDKATGQYADSIIIITDGDNNIIRNMDGTGNEHSYHTNGSIISVHSGAGNQIYSNILHDMTADPTPVESVVNAAAVYVFAATGTRVYNNTIYNCNNGIAWKTGPADMHVYWNFLYNIGRAAFFPTYETDGIEDAVVHHNVVLNAFRLVDFEDSPASTMTGFRFYNNTSYSSGAMAGRALIMGLSGGNQPAREMEFYNNIISVGGSTRFLEIYATTSVSFPTVLNYNAYYSSSGTPSWSRNATVNTTLANWRTTAQAVLPGAEANSITTNPLFVSAGGTNAVDYKLQGGSPAIGTGQGGVDMGAYEGNPCIGAVCVVGGTGRLFGGVRFTGSGRMP